MKKDEIQNKIYLLLCNANMNEISARFVAYKLVEKQVYSITNIEQKADKQFLIISKSAKYLVNLPIIPIPDASIELV